MRRKLTAVGSALGTLLATLPAHAQGQGLDFGDKGEFILSADRLVPLFSYSHVSANVPGTNMTDTTSNSSISLLWGANGPAGNGGGASLFFTVPRVGFDYVLAHNVTIGGDIVVLLPLGGTHSVETTANGQSTTVSNDSPTNLGFGIAPRVGYVLRVSSLFSFWLRGGVSFYTLTNKTTDTTGANTTTVSTNINQFALDLDPQFVVTAIPHVGFTAGLGMDIPLVGQNSVEDTFNNRSQSQSGSSSILFIGVTLGMFAYF